MEIKIGDDNVNDVKEEWEEILDDANWADVIDKVNLLMDSIYNVEGAELVYELKNAIRNEVQQILKENKL